MKFVDKFPDMKYIDDENSGIIRSRSQTACAICGWPTEFVEINYEAHFCSDECVAEMDERCSKYAKENCQKAQEGCAETGCRPFG